jgi:hypothetical protein
MIVTKVGPMQDNMASGSNPADAEGPGFALTDENQRPLFVFIFENQRQRDAAAKQLGGILETAVWAGPALSCTCPHRAIKRTRSPRLRAVSELASDSGVERGETFQHWKGGAS